MLAACLALRQNQEEIQQWDRQRRHLKVVRLALAGAMLMESIRMFLPTRMLLARRKDRARERRVGRNQHKYHRRDCQRQHG